VKELAVLVRYKTNDFEYATAAKNLTEKTRSAIKRLSADMAK